MKKTVPLFQFYYPFFLAIPGRLLFLFVPLFICLLSFGAAAQNNILKQWDQTSGGSANDYFSASVATPDGGYLLGGSSYSAKSGNKSESNRGEFTCNSGPCYYTSEDYWLVKIDANGKKVWDKTLGGQGSDQLKAMVAVPEGGYLLAGTSYSPSSGDKTADSKGYSDYWVVKIDLYGNKVWDQTFGGAGADDLRAVLTTADGGYLLGGTSFSGIGGDKSAGNRGENSSDYWVMKINRKGEKVWDKTFGGSNTDYLASLAATPDGHYLLGGSSNSRVSGDKTAVNASSTPDAYSMWVVKIDDQGNKKWDKSYGFSDRDNYLTTLFFDPLTDGFLLGGSASGASTGDYDYDYVVQKIDKNGNPNWLNTFGGKNNDFLSTITEAPDGTFLLGGTSNSNKGEDKSENSIGYEDFWLVRLNKHGNRMLWDKTIGGRASDLLQTMLPTVDGGYLLGSYSNSFQGGYKSENGQGKQDYWVLKFNYDFPPVTSATDFRFGGTGQDNFTQLIKTGDNGYLFGGYSISGRNGDKSQPSRGGFDYWVIKTDAAGKEMWNKRFGGTKNDYLNSIMQTPDGGYLLGGSSESGVGGDKSGVSRGDRDFWVVKLNSAGEKEWDRTVGGSGFEDLRQVRQLASGNYVAAGYSISPAGDDKSESSRGGHDYWVVILNRNGNKLADYRYGGIANDYLQDLLVNPDGSLLLGGTSISGAGGDRSQASQGISDYWVVKIDAAGQVLWDKSYGSTKMDNLFALAAIGNDYILAGNSNSPAFGDKSQNSRGGDDFWVLKIDATGQKLWDKTYGGAEREKLRSLAVTADGGLLLGGTSFSDASGDKTQNSQGNSDYWLVKTNSAGLKQWDQRFGGSNKDELRTLIHENDGSCLLGGRSDSGISGDRTQASHGRTDYWLIKVPVSAGTMSAPSRVALNPGAEKTNSLEPLLLRTYPNPFRDKITVKMPVLAANTLVSLLVYDSQGKQVATLFQGEAQANQIYEKHWQPAPALPAGLYLIRWQTNDKVSYQKVWLSR